MQPIAAAADEFSTSLDNLFTDAYVVAPSSPVGYVILTVFALGAILLIYALRGQWRALNFRSWLIVLIFSTLALVIGSIDRVPLSYITPASVESVSAGQSIPLTPLGLALFILVGALVNPAGAFLVALSFGIGRGLWATHQIYDFFIPVFVATLVAVIMYQRYAGRLYEWLRKPVIAGFLGAFLQILLVLLAIWATRSALLGGLVSFDRAMSTALEQAPYLIANAIFASLLVWLFLSLVPSARKRIGPSRSPFSLSLNRKLASTYLMLIGLVGVLLLVLGYAVARQTAKDALTAKMAEQTEVAAESIAGYLNTQGQWLDWISASDDLSLSPSSQSASDPRVIDSFAERFESAYVLDRDLQAMSLYPEQGIPTALAPAEIAALGQVIHRGADDIVSIPQEDAGSIVDLVNVGPENSNVAAATVGRISPTSIMEAIPDSLQPPSGGEFTVVDGAGNQISSPAGDGGAKNTGTGNRASSQILKALGIKESQNIVHSSEMPEIGWTVNMSVPEETLIQESLESLGRGAILFLGAVVISAAVLFLVVRTIAEALNQIADSTLQAARNQSDFSVRTNGHDEIDGLAKAVRRLQIKHKQRLEEQRLLLDVSDQVASSFDLNQAMPTLLSRLMSGTYATGARAVISSPKQSAPLTFNAGPSKKSFALLDGAILRLIRPKSELILRTPQAVQETLGAEGNNHILPQSLAAIRLESRDLHSVLYVWRDSPHHWDTGQLRLLRTLCGHATTLIENASLLAKVVGSRRRMAAILGSTADAVVATDDEGRVLLFNSAMEGYFGVQSQTAIGQPIEEVIDAPALVEALNDGASPRGRLEVETNDGRVLDCAFAQFNGSTVLEAGKVAVLHDITHIKEIDALKSEFVSNVSHDLRSPLAFMTNYAALIPTQGELKPKQQLWLDKIVLGIEEMTSLIETLLDLQRLEAGVALEMTDFPIDSLLRAVVEEFRHHAEEQGVSIELHMGTDYPRIEGDPDLVRQSLRNLLSNAIKYAPESGPVAVGARIEGDMLIISVEDRGPGIPEHERARVFEMFYRAPAARMANRKGKGLGLAFVKSTAERHGGKAWCESQLGKGSTFFFTLPIVQEPAFELLA